MALLSLVEGTKDWCRQRPEVRAVSAHWLASEPTRLAPTLVGSYISPVFIT